MRRDTVAYYRYVTKQKLIYRPRASWKFGSDFRLLAYCGGQRGSI
jgi:hypothetical protein